MPYLCAGKTVKQPNKLKSMKNITLFIVFLWASSLFIQWKALVTSLKISPVIQNEKTIFFPNDAERIELNGTLMFNHQSSIEAAVNDYAVYIQFNQNFGNVSISLYNQSGALIHNGMVDTSVQSQVVIPFLNSTNGTYTLVLENVSGYVEGEFVED